MATMHAVRPSWYTDEDDSAWERVKEAFRRDWRQTKHDFGSKQPDLNQRASDTIAQARGTKPVPFGNTPTRHDDDAYKEDDEAAYRYGYAAYRHHGSCCDIDDANTDAMLRHDFGDEVEWNQKRQAVRRGWFYAKNQGSDYGDI